VNNTGGGSSDEKFVSGGDSTALREQMKILPGAPGVYMFKDCAGRVLYIGKAKNLKNRVRSYFSGNPPDPKIPRMLAVSASIEHVVLPGEVDALLLESRLIKDLQPKYNRALKDGKSYPFVAIEREKDFPRVQITRGREKKNFTYIGPFTDARSLRSALRILQQIFAFRTCAIEIETDKKAHMRRRPCLLYNVGFCLGPCAGRVSKEEYAFALQGLKKVLQGRKETLFKDLKRAMRDASARLEFEKAAALRDRIEALKSLSKRSKHGDLHTPETLAVNPKEGAASLKENLGLAFLPRVLDGIDIATLMGGESVGSIVRFIDGLPCKDEYRRYRIKTVEGMDDYAMMREVVTRRFARVERGEETAPDILLLDGGKGQLAVALEALKDFKVRPRLALALAKSEEKIYIEGRNNAVVLSKNTSALRLLMHVRDEAHRFAGHYHRILRRKRVFSVDTNSNK
jgi:excinuclease ABC subunit C